MSACYMKVQGKALHLSDSHNPILQRSKLWHLHQSAYYFKVKFTIKLHSYVVILIQEYTEKYLTVD